MTPELAEHISLLAAPLLAVMLAPWVDAGETLPPAKLAEIRKHAITQACALWLQTLDTPDTDL